MTVKHPEIKVIASCGLHNDAEESTLTAFENAIRAGIEMTETDLRRCLDGVILLHDEEVGGRPVEELTRREIQDVLGILPPTLYDFVECCRGRLGVDFELKVDGLEEEVLKLAQANFRPDEYVITSFRPSVLARVHELAPDAPVGLLTIRGLTYLFDKYPQIADYRPPQDILEHARDLHVDFLVPDCLDLELFRACDEADVETIAWAVNTAERLRSLLGVHHLRGVIGERPVLMRHLLEEEPDPTYFDPAQADPADPTYAAAEAQ
jgi:glycerophosphoryl diester phosphodiesterase